MGCPKRNGQPLIALRKIPHRTHIVVGVVLVVVVPVPIVEIEVVCVIIVGSVLGRRPDNADYVCSVIRMYNRIRLPKKRHLFRPAIPQRRSNIDVEDSFEKGC